MMLVVDEGFFCGCKGKFGLNNITIVWTVAMVNCLARLHNFCIDEADRLGEVSRVEEQLPLDLENMINNTDGYAPLMMDVNHDGIVFPLE